MHFGFAKKYNYKHTYLILLYFLLDQIFNHFLADL